jgi:hypothetical protein
MRALITILTAHMLRVPLKSIITPAEQKKGGSRTKSDLDYWG